MLCLNPSRLVDQYREGVLAIAAGAVLIVAASASVAEAQYTPNIQGGGAPTYRQDFNCYGMPLTNPPDPAADTGVPLQCQGAGYPIDSTKIFRYASATPDATTAGMGTSAPPIGTDRQNPSNWVPLIADPSDPAAYPIVGYTTQEFYTCYQLTSGQDVKAKSVRGYLTWALSPIDPVPDSVLNDNGFAPLPGVWKSAILDTFVTGDANNLQIRVGPVSGVCSSGG